MFLRNSQPQFELLYQYQDRPHRNKVSKRRGHTSPASGLNLSCIAHFYTHVGSDKIETPVFHLRMSICKLKYIIFVRSLVICTPGPQGEWRRLHNEELSDLYSLPNIVCW